MIRIPLDAYGYHDGRAPDIAVGWQYDSGISMDVGLEANQFVGSRTPTPGTDDDLITETKGWTVNDTPDRMDMVHCLAVEVLKLRRDLQSVRDETHLSRTLNADEARALAAMLNHFADESERLR